MLGSCLARGYGCKAAPGMGRGIAAMAVPLTRLYKQFLSVHNVGMPVSKFLKDDNAGSLSLDGLTLITYTMYNIEQLYFK